MNWDKLKPNHYFKDPITHIYAQDIFDTKEYDRLYENQNDFDHKTWQEFDTLYRIGFEFKDDFSEIDFNKEIMCLWFFKERADNTQSYVCVNDKKLVYLPNAFLVTKSKNIKFVQKNRKYIRHPFIQIDMTNDQWQKLLRKFR